MKAKKLLSLLLLIAMTISMFVPVQAADTSGKMGDNVTWSFDTSTGTVTISGNGATYDYSEWEQAPGEDIDTLSIKKLVIEEGITELGDYSCSNFALFDPVIYIPKSVIKLGRMSLAFPITDIYYGGSQSDWEKIEKPYSSYGAGATVHFNSYNTSSTGQKNQSVSQNQPVSTGTSASSNGIKVYIDNKIVSFDVQPQLIGGRTMVPLRAIFEGLGATVDWNGDTQTVTAYNEVTIVTATIGQYTMTVNGTTKTMDVAPMVIDGRTLVPARFVAEAFDCDVEWDGNTQTVYITTKPLDYSKVEQDISVTTPSTTTPSTTPSTTTPSQVTVPDKKEEINTTPVVDETPASSGGYKVETLKTDNIDMHEVGRGVLKKYRRSFYAMTQVGDDIYYANRKKQIIKINIVSGETSVYRELNKAKIDVDGQEYEFDVTEITCLYYDNARNAVNCICEWERYDILEESNWSGYGILNLSTMKQIDEDLFGGGVMGYIYGTNKNGDVFVPVVPTSYGEKEVGYKAIATLRFPDYYGDWDSDGKFKDSDFNFSGELQEIYGATPDDVQLINGELWYFNKGEIIGIDETYLYIMNKNYLVKTDHDRNIIESCKYTDIDLIDGEELYNKKMPRLFIGSNGEVVFYDLELNAFRRITKN